MAEKQKSDDLFELELKKLYKDYGFLDTFVNDHSTIPFVQLDYAFVYQLTLFTIEPDFKFNELEAKIDKIISAMPAIKRIFAQPFIHLIENDIILPVEAVRIINNNTINHIASHAELWSDIKENNEIMPRKLLSRTYQDNYGIYENLVFCDVIDEIFVFVRNNIRFLKEMIYTNQTIEINLLDRLNHLNYFLALGKLHTGYSRNFDAYYAIAKRCLNKMQFIENTIVPRLHRPVYAKNKLRKKHVKLRKTNILSMHKEYKQIYKLAKFFETQSVKVVDNIDPDIYKLQKDYFYFVEMLTIFSITHFNFVCDEQAMVNFDKLNLNFKFKSWSLHIQSSLYGQQRILVIDIQKEKNYRLIILPAIMDAAEIYTIEMDFEADEYIVTTPFEEKAKGNTKFIALNNIDSFRRIQQMLLKGMVYADVKRDECPFCQNKLSKDEERSTPYDEVHSCISCRTVIGKHTCPNTHKSYLYTEIANFHKKKVEDEQIESTNEWLEKRKKESAMYYRNITDIDDDLNVVCPFCEQAHFKK